MVASGVDGVTPLSGSEQQQFVVRYKAAPKWILELFGLASVASILLLAIFGLGSNDPATATVLGGVCLLFILMALLMRDNRIILRPEGLYFPPYMLPGLYFRTSRTWTDIGAVMLVDSERPDYFMLDEYDSKELLIHFVSGGSVKLSLSAVSLPDLEKFFKASKRWGSTAVFQEELIDLKRKLFSGPSQTKQISFTTLWEEEMQQHFTTTNFVPLDRGKTLQSGRFRIMSQLTAGGLSAIYLAEKGDKRIVVLKEAVVPPNADEQTRAKAKELFEREARLLLRLNHPNIARVFDHFVERGRDYLVIEYIAGQSLRQLITRNGPQSEERVLQWAKEIAEILIYLHFQDPPIIHRDLSPDNLLLREDGKLFLIDFGAANEFVGTATGTLIGKQSYISPEQFRGKAVPASDIYGFGGTLHYLLTGSEPEALSVSHPAVVRPVLSAQIDQLVADCTQLEVADRIKDARELKQRIEETKAAERGTVLKMPGGATPR
jgi:tRNA A-37 threonylcarbamoyl transferase component Bud32